MQLCRAIICMTFQRNYSSSCPTNLSRMNLLMSIRPGVDMYLLSWSRRAPLWWTVPLVALYNYDFMNLGCQWPLWFRGQNIAMEENVHIYLVCTGTSISPSTVRLYLYNHWLSRSISIHQIYWIWCDSSMVYKRIDNNDFPFILSSWYACTSPILACVK
jgi:uncharacterized membrane protein